MKGIILAGGKGTRLGDATKVVNKHLLQVYDKPMIYYPLETLLDNGIKDITIVTESMFIPQYMELLGSGKLTYCKKYNEHTIDYIVQDEPDGIAGALKTYKQRKVKVDGLVAVILGDNYFDEVPDLREIHVPTVFLREKYNVKGFGVAEIYANMVKHIEEKPKKPKSNLVVTGLYVYDEHLWDYLDTINKSARGEYEITDINNLYAEGHIGLEYKLIKEYWSDMGTPDSLLNTAIHIRKNKIIEEVYPK